MDATTLDQFKLELGQGSEIGLAFIIALMMFAVALGLRTEHFQFFKDNPKVYLAGVAAQIIGLPLLTLLICFVVKPYPSVALGMILIACCPGGNTSNLLALFGRANTALSVSLTATSSICAAFITPVAILFWCSLYPPTSQLLTEINLDIVSFLKQSLVILALPLLLGMRGAKFAPTLASKLQKPLALLGGLGLIFLVVMGFKKYAAEFLEIGAALFMLVVIHNGLAFLMGNVVARLAGATTRERRALTFEVGIQNSGLGIVILLTQLGGFGGAGAVAGLWGTWHIIGGLMLVVLFQYQDRKLPKGSEHV